jgi:hypothetical protein
MGTAQSDPIKHLAVVRFRQSTIYWYVVSALVALSHQRLKPLLRISITRQAVQLPLTTEGGTTPPFRRLYRSRKIKAVRKLPPASFEVQPF